MATFVPISGATLGKKLVEIFGLEGQGVRRIVIDVEVGAVAKLYVECMPTKDQAGMLVKELEKVKAGLETHDLNYDQIDNGGFRIWPEARRDRQIRDGEDPAERGGTGAGDVRP